MDNPSHFWSLVPSGVWEVYQTIADDSIYILRIKVEDDLSIAYAFSEDCPTIKSKFECEGRVVVDWVSKRITRQTLFDKHNDNFTPNTSFMFSMFFVDFPANTPVPKPEVTGRIPRE